MKHQIPSWLTETANKVARFGWAKRLLKPPYYAYKRRVQRKRNEDFRRHALGLMRLFHQTMELAGIEYTLAFGTLLGAVREKGFIAHDLDIDVAVWHSQQDARVRTVLETAGFAFSHSFEVDGGELGREETYIYNGVAIDIFYFYPSLTEGGLPYCCDFLGKPGAPTYRACMKKYGGALPRRVELPMERNRELVPFADLRLFIPTNADEILSSRYGDDYMTPNPGWGITSHDAHIVRWEEKLGIYKEA